MRDERANRPAPLAVGPTGAAAIRGAAIAWLLAAATAVAQPAADGVSSDRVEALVLRLDAKVAETRAAAEAKLVGLAERTPIALLAVLPKRELGMPPTVAAGLARVRRAAEQQLARDAIATSRITLDVTDTPLPAVLEAITLQSGNTLADRRAAFGGAVDDRAAAQRVTLSAADEPFWPVLDRVLDAADLSVYPFANGNQLPLVERASGTEPRVGDACYAGPLRVEALRVEASRDRRVPQQSQLSVVVEAAWEPRLRPILVSQSLTELSATLPSGESLKAKTTVESLELEVNSAMQAVEMNLVFEPAPQDATAIEKLAGQLELVVPAERREFRFASIGDAEAPATQTFGDATVTVERFAKQGPIWELRMRLRLDGAGDAFASHRGWVAQNTSYLVDDRGRRIEYAGLETTMQDPDEVGFAYLFDLSGGAVYGFGETDESLAFGADAFQDEAEEAGSDEDEGIDPAKLTWVYETATGVYVAPVDWKLGPIGLP